MCQKYLISNSYSPVLSFSCCTACFPFSCCSQVYFTVPPTGRTFCLLTWNELLRALLCQYVLYSLLELKMTKRIRSMLPSQSVTELDGSCHSWHCTYLETHLCQQLQYRQRVAGCRGYVCKLLKAVLSPFKWGPWSKTKCSLWIFTNLAKDYRELRLLCFMKLKKNNSKKKHRPQGGICVTIIHHRHHRHINFHITSSLCPNTWWWKPLISILITATETF